MNQKAQASTEYLVILAVVVIVAVVVATLMGDFISLGGETSDRSSKLYWKNAEIGLMDWIMSSDGEDALVVRNNQEYDIYIHNITVDGNAESLNASVRTGEQKTLKADWTDCEKDESYGYFVTFVYDNTEFNLTGKSFTGGEKVVGTCS